MRRPAVAVGSCTFEVHTVVVMDHAVPSQGHATSEVVSNRDRRAVALPEAREAELRRPSPALRLRLL